MEKKMKNSIETIFAQEAILNSEKKSCKTCKSKKTKKYIIGLFVISTYLFGTAIYGNYVLFQKLVNFIFG